MVYLLSYLYSYISPLIIFCLRHLLLFTCKQGCLQTCKYAQSLPITETYIATKFHVDIWLLFLVMGVESEGGEEEEQNEEFCPSLHSSIHL